MTYDNWKSSNSSDNELGSNPRYQEYRYRLKPGQCKTCDECRNDPMMPSHTASQFCESGKRNHCTCDFCY